MILLCYCDILTKVANFFVPCCILRRNFFRFNNIFIDRICLTYIKGVEGWGGGGDTTNVAYNLHQNVKDIEILSFKF